MSSQCYGYSRIKPYDDISHVGLDYHYEPVISLLQHSEHDHVNFDRISVVNFPFKCHVRV